MIIDMMIVIFTEIRHCKELINFLSILDLKNCAILTARLNKSLLIST